MAQLIYADKLLAIQDLENITDAFLVIAATSCKAVVFATRSDIEIDETNLITSKISRIPKTCHGIAFDFPVQDFCLKSGNDKLIDFENTDKLVRIIHFDITYKLGDITMSYRCSDKVSRFDPILYPKFMKPCITYTVEQTNAESASQESFITGFKSEIIFA